MLSEFEDTFYQLNDRHATALSWRIRLFEQRSANSFIELPMASLAALNKLLIVIKCYNGHCVTMRFDLVCAMQRSSLVQISIVLLMYNYAYSLLQHAHV